MTANTPRKTTKSRIREKPDHVFPWCAQCDYHDTCYDLSTGYNGPHCLDPTCGDGPVIGHCQVILGSEDDYLDWMRAVSSGSPGP